MFVPAPVEMVYYPLTVFGRLYKKERHRCNRKG